MLVTVYAVGYSDVPLEWTYLENSIRQSTTIHLNRPITLYKCVYTIQSITPVHHIFIIKLINVLQETTLCTQPFKNNIYSSRTCIYLYMYDARLQGDKNTNTLKQKM